MDGLVVMQMKDTTTQSRIGRVNNGSSIWEWKCKHESASKHSSRLRNNNLKMCECVALWKKVRHNCLHNTQGIQVHQKWLWERFGSFKWELKTVLKMNMGAGVVRYTGETETVPLYSPQGTLSLSSYEGGGEKQHILTGTIFSKITPTWIIPEWFDEYRSRLSGSCHSLQYVSQTK